MNIFIKKVEEVKDAELPIDPEPYQSNTSVTEARNHKYKAIISEIVENFIYLGSDFIAQDKDTLKKTGITHIINCSGDWSKNYYEGEFEYKRYHLKDHPIENIECVFYDAIEFIERCQAENGKVYVHCVQGISRSATIIMSYLILKQGMDYATTFKFM